MSTFTPSGSGGLPPSSVVVTGATTPTLANVAASLASTEYSYALPSSSQLFTIKLRGGNATLQLAYSVGTSGTTYLTIPKGCSYTVGGLDISNTVVLYFQSPTAGQVVEIESWS